MGTRKKARTAAPEWELTCFDVLPDEIVEHIFSFLDQRDIFRVALVCRRFAHRSFTHERRFVLLRNPKVVSNGQYARFSRLRVQRLELGEEYSMKSRVVTSVLRTLSSVHTLQTLVHHERSNDSDFATVAGVLPGLRRLNFTCCQYVTDAGISLLTALTRLKSLRLLGCRHVSPAGACRLTALTGLTALDLEVESSRSYKDIDNELLWQVTAFRNLRSLSLGFCREVSDEGLLYVIRAHSQLTSLALRFCRNITDFGFSHVTSLHSLVKLDFWGCEAITDIGVMRLSALRALTFLEVSMNIGDAGLRHIASCPALKDLRLCGNSFHDIGLHFLVSLKPLKYLNLFDCEAFTGAEVVRFERRRPDVRVDWEIY